MKFSRAAPAGKSQSSWRVAGVYLILLGMAAAGIGCLLIDHAIIGWLFAHPSTWQDNAWVFAFRQLGKAGTPIWLLLVWSCLTNRWRPTLVTIAALILVGASVCPLKGLVLRYRPGRDRHRPLKRRRRLKRFPGIRECRSPRGTRR